MSVSPNVRDLAVLTLGRPRTEVVSMLLVLGQAACALKSVCRYRPKTEWLALSW